MISPYFAISSLGHSCFGVTGQLSSDSNQISFGSAARCLLFVSKTLAYIRTMALKDLRGTSGWRNCISDTLHGVGTPVPETIIVVVCCCLFCADVFQWV